MPGCMTCLSGCCYSMYCCVFVSERLMLALCVVRLPLLANVMTKGHVSLNWSSASSSLNPMKICAPACFCAAVSVLLPHCLWLQASKSCLGRGSCCCSGQDVAIVRMR